jgi:hypothetical protein
MLKSILNAGREYKSAEELFESVQKIYEHIEQIKDLFGIK